MACGTCGHTMAMVSDSIPRTVWHCPRCGTIRSNHLGIVEDTVPKLVERCRVYETEGYIVATEWRRLGIAESIQIPTEADLRIRKDSSHDPDRI